MQSQVLDLANVDLKVLDYSFKVRKNYNHRR